MATTERQQEPLVSDLLEQLEPAEGIETGSSRRRGGPGRWLLRGVVLLILVGLGAVGFAKLAGSFDTRGSGSMLTHVVRRGELLVTITEDGNLESANNVQIKCEVAGGSTILSIVEDGKRVEKGEELARLDSSQLEDQINQQRITYEKARAAHIQAEKDYEVAKISVQEYLEGTYLKELQDLEAQVTIAMENLRTAENTLQYTQRMFRKGYATPLQLEAQQFAVKRAQLELESAETAKKVLIEFTKVKTLEDLQSKRDTAEAKKDSEKAAFELEEARLRRFEAQLAKCVIRAPQAGMAVYANETGRHRFGSQQPQVEEGAMVREQQDIFHLPDLSQMQVRVAVHESKVDQLQVGMRARIRIQNDEFQGTVVSVANQPEPSFFFSAAVKEYATIVKIEGEQTDIRPGMTAEAEILVAHLKDVLTLPVAAIVEQRGKFLCWVKAGDKVERRPLVLGMSNDKYVEVKDGVAEGEEVILNPRAVVPEAREEEQETETVDVEARFGRSSGVEMGGPGRARGGDRPGGPAAKPAPGGPPGAESAPSGPPGGAGSGPPPGGAGRGPGGGRRNLMDLDQDGDGKISRDEAPERMRDFFSNIDTNGDGFIDNAEINAMRQRFGGGGPPGTGPGASGGGPGGSAPGGAPGPGGGDPPRGGPP